MADEPHTHSETIYKICPEPLWEEAVASGKFSGAGIDVADGFIHFSSASQVRETAAKHFQGKGGLVLVGVSSAKLGELLKWEKSRGGDLFPHLYGDLPLDAVDTVEPLPLNDQGIHCFPAAIP